MNSPVVRCPECRSEREIEHVLTAQSNQNVIYQCSQCGYELRNIKTDKG
ncbi:hypothetical protein ACN6MY_09210 [Peribacillus sp. B-H-3]